MRLLFDMSGRDWNATNGITSPFNELSSAENVRMSMRTATR
jgi:hypothetical protein